MQDDAHTNRGDSGSDGQSRELSLVALFILHAVARGVNHAFAIIQLTGISGGTVHHSLDRMERAGWLVSEKEHPEVARAEKRSPRRNYAITPGGLAKLNDTLARLTALGEIRQPKFARPLRGAGSERKPRRQMRGNAPGCRHRDGALD